MLIQIFFLVLSLGNKQPNDTHFIHFIELQRSNSIVFRRQTMNELSIGTNAMRPLEETVSKSKSCILSLFGFVRSREKAFEVDRQLIRAVNEGVAYTDCAELSILCFHIQFAGWELS